MRQGLLNLEKLKQVFDDSNIPDRYYILDGHLYYDDCMIIENVYNKWIVYYFERGNRYNEVSFSNEQEACEYMKNEVFRMIELENDTN